MDKHPTFQDMRTPMNEDDILLYISRLIIQISFTVNWGRVQLRVYKCHTRQAHMVVGIRCNVIKSQEC